MPWISIYSYIVVHLCVRFVPREMYYIFISIKKKNTRKSDCIVIRRNTYEM